MSRLQQEAKQKNRISQRKQLLVGGTVVISILAVVLVVFWSSIGNVFNASASSVDSLASIDYWRLSSVSTQASGKEFDLEISADMDIFLVAKVLDVDSKVLKKEYIQVRKGLSHYAINGVDKMPAGEYVVEVVGEDKAISKRVVKE